MTEPVQILAECLPPVGYLPTPEDKMDAPEILARLQARGYELRPADDTEQAVHDGATVGPVNTATYARTYPDGATESLTIEADQNDIVQVSTEALDRLLTIAGFTKVDGPPPHPLVRS